MDDRATLDIRRERDLDRRSARARTGATYWRSLEEVAETPEFQEFLHREFPENASEWTDPVGRRSFLKLMSASLALAGVSALHGAARRSSSFPTCASRKR